MASNIVAEATKRLAPPLIRRAYLPADQASKQLVWLPGHSPLGRRRPRPGYVAFFEISSDGKRP